MVIVLIRKMRITLVSSLVTTCFVGIVQVRVAAIQDWEKGLEPKE